MRKIIFSLCALLVIISCDDKESVLDGVIQNSDLYAIVEPVDATKTSMDGNNNILWLEGDQLVAFMKSSLGNKYQIKEQYIGTTTGGFSKVEESGTGVDPVTGQELDHNVVLYPYSSDVLCMKNDGNTPAQSYKLDLVLPHMQLYAENSFANGSLPMMAISSNNQFAFRNLCGCLKLKIKGVDKIKSIKLEGLGEELISGRSSVVGYVDGSAPTVTMDALQATKSITLDCGEGVQLNMESPTTFIISVPPVEFKSGLKITITDTDGFSKVLTNPSANTIKRSSLLTFAMVIEEILPEDDDLSQYSDLSESGTANCYLVKGAGKYRFKAVKGNSSISVGDVAQAEVLWESFGTDVTPLSGALVASVESKDGYVTFTTPETFKNGNAVIAAKDAGGKILWSWHIWSSKEGWRDQIYPNNAGIMMDRNLGAVSAIPGEVGALGLLYQWGRKDPFLGSCSISEKRLALSTGNWGMVKGQQSVDYTVENPMMFIHGNSEWCSSSTEDQRWMDTQKTMYDPCPAGYRVPKGGSDGFWAVSKITTQFDNVNKGRYCTLADDVTVWYPAVGYRSYSDGELTNLATHGYYWSSTPLSNSVTNAYNLFLSTGGFLGTLTSLRANGVAVRCVRE